MQILFHIGAHATDDGLLIRSILRNRAALAAQGIAVPGPSRYRELIGSVSTRLRGEPASEDTEAMLLEAIQDDDSAERIVLSNENFLCRDAVVLTDEGLYPKAQKSAWLRNCFPGHDVEFALCLRNPATLAPAVLARLSDDDRALALNALVPERLRWLDVVVDIATSAPDTPITVWRHEDAPCIWADLLSDLTACDPATALDGGDDMLDHTLRDRGRAALAAFLSDQPDPTRDQRHAAIRAFIDAHKTPCENTIPGWSEDTVSRLTQAYDSDVAAIAEMDAVTMIRA